MGLTPYVHFYQFGVRPETMDVWVPHAHNNLSVMARQEGLMSMRLFRDRQDPTRFFSIRVWRTRADAERALASPEVQLAIRTNVEHRMSEGFPTVERAFALLDHVFGRKGVRNFLRREGGFTQVVFVNVLPENLERWTPYRRNSASVMARQNGVCSHETMQDLDDPTQYLVLRNYEDDSYASDMKGATAEYRPNREIQYVTKVAADLGVYKGSQPSRFVDCDTWDGVLGPDGAADYRRFMEELEPA
jgi:quinol monooxygenase YgiN